MQTAAGQPALLARFGVGHDNVDKSLARRHGIFVTNTPGTLGRQRCRTHALAAGQSGQTNQPPGASTPPGPMEPDGRNRTPRQDAGRIGFGAIGRCVAAAAHFGFGMRVVAVGSRPADDLQRREGRPLDELLAAAGAAEYTDNLAAALGQADAVTLHAPATAATRHLINRERLELLNPGALLINTARGALVDEAALYDALAAGRLAGAALDVFENEPYRPVVARKGPAKSRQCACSRRTSARTRSRPTAAWPSRSWKASAASWQASSMAFPELIHTSLCKCLRVKKPLFLCIHSQ